MNKNLIKFIFSVVLLAIAYLSMSFISLNFGWVLETTAEDGNNIAQFGRALLAVVTVALALFVVADWNR